jgi:two-component system, NarL family, response regulator YdfI
VIRVFIVAASPLARAGLANLLAARGVEVAGSVANVEALVGQLPDVATDVVLVDASGEPPEALIESLAESDLASEIVIVALADQPQPGWSAEAICSGLRAVLPGDISPDQLLVALQAAAAGLVVMHPADLGASLPAANHSRRPMAELAEPLTRREREVLQMLAVGLGNKEIATRLNISDHTVKFHVASILGKLGAASRTEAVTLAIRRGLVLL